MTGVTTLQVLIFIELIKTFLYTDALRCYNCASSLPSNISRDAQRAFKMVLYTTYIVPPVERLCTDPEDVEFKTVPQSVCSSSDQCVKIMVQQQDLQFVMRGCQSRMYRDQVSGNDVQCGHNISPSVCLCTESLCNGAHQQLLIPSFVPCLICSFVFFSSDLIILITMMI